MNAIYQKISKASIEGKKMIAILIDPDEVDFHSMDLIVEKINASMIDFIFVGGSDVQIGLTDRLVEKLKQSSDIPIVLFPGDVDQISNKADAMLFLSLISGRNPDYLI